MKNKLKEGEIYFVSGHPFTVIKIKKKWKDYFDIDELFVVKKNTIPHAIAYNSHIIKQFFKGPDPKIIIMELFNHEK